MKNAVEISASGQGWKRFRSNPVSLVSLMVIILMIFTAIAGYLLCPDKSPNANTQHLELAAKKPGFTITMLKVRRNKQIRVNGFIKTMLFRTGTFNGYAACFKLPVQRRQHRCQKLYRDPGKGKNLPVVFFTRCGVRTEGRGESHDKF